MANDGVLHHLYGTARWKRLREAQLSLEPLCRMCLEAEDVEAATICDHVTPHRGDVVLFWSGPFQSLCKAHHDGAKQRMDRGQSVVRYGADGWPI